MNDPIMDLGDILHRLTQQGVVTEYPPAIACAYGVEEGRKFLMTLSHLGAPLEADIVQAVIEMVGTLQKRWAKKTGTILRPDDEVVMLPRDEIVVVVEREFKQVQDYLTEHQAELDQWLAEKETADGVDGPTTEGHA